MYIREIPGRYGVAVLFLIVRVYPLALLTREVCAIEDIHLRVVRLCYVRCFDAIPITLYPIAECIHPWYTHRMSSNPQVHPPLSVFVHFCSKSEFISIRIPTVAPTQCKFR